MSTIMKYYSMHHIILVIISLLLVVQQQHTSNAANFNEPHAHRGKVTPYPPGDPKVTLDAKALKILDSGKPYQTQITQGASGRALCVQDIHAPPSTVWNRILDFNAYSRMVPRVTHSQNYLILPSKKGAKTIYTRMTIGFPMLKIEYFIKHLFFESKSSLTWTLDYEKRSDLDDSVGYWFVRDHPEKRGWSRVYYSVELVIFDWVPQVVKNILMGKALSDATAWVKRESEKERIAMEKKNGAVDDVSSTTSTETKKSFQKRKRRDAFGKFFRKVLFLDKKSIRDGMSTCSSSSTVGSDDLSSSSCLDESSSSDRASSQEATTSVPQRAGLLRIVLVSLVFLLIVVNLGLFLERVSQ